MDIKDGFATSSKEHLRSLVRVHELDETTSKEAPSRGEEGRHRQKGNHDQRCHDQHLDGVIFSFVHRL
jgi:hypothetical protein